MMQTEIRLGAATLDTYRRSLFFNGAEIPLTETEFEAICVFAERFGHPLSRDHLSLRLYGREWNGCNRAVDVCVGRLRRKLRDGTAGYFTIRSVRGVGYLMFSRG